MSDIETTHRSEHAVGGPEAALGLHAVRVWPAVVLLAIFWAFLYANHNADLSMFVRFISRMAAYGILLLLFLAWWLTRSKIRWRDRLLAIGVVIGVGIAASLLADKTMRGFVLFMSAFPIAFTAWTAWILIARGLTPKFQRIGFSFAMILAFGYFTLVRWDGLNAAQRAEMSWRWQPTSEQAFLASRDQVAVPTDLTGATVAAEPWTLQSGDCPEFRGTQRDGVIAGLRLATDWSDNPPRLLWRQRVGPGWSGLIVVDDHLVTQEQRGEVETVVCYDATTGAEIWVHENPVRFEESLSGPGPRGTPTFATGHIYTIGAKGTLNCLRAETGAVVWTRDIVADAEVGPNESPPWGYSVSPLVLNGLVIVRAGGTREKSILAYRADDGHLTWTRAAGTQSYSSPQRVELDGQEQILLHDNHTLMALDIDDGAVLWEHPSANKMAVPMLQPHLTESGELVISMEPGAALVHVEQNGKSWSAVPRWTTNQFKPGFNDFLIHDGHIYGLDDGILSCFDLATGKRLWKKGRLGHGQMLLIVDQDALLVSSDTGEVLLVTVNPKGYEELGRFQAIEGKTWNSPVLVGNRLFLRNGQEMAAYELRAEPALAASE